MKTKSKQKMKGKPLSNGPTRRDTKRESDEKLPEPPPKPVGRRVSLDNTEQIYKLLRTATNDRKQGLITVEEARCITYMCHELFAMRADLDVQKEMDELKEQFRRSPQYAKQPV